MKILAVLSVMCLLSSSAFAMPGFYSKFKKAYPNSKTADAKCLVCHKNADPTEDGERNAYGQDFENNDMDFAAIESLDSDVDGVSNINEINAGTLPGNADSH